MVFYGLSGGVQLQQRPAVEHVRQGVERRDLGVSDVTLRLADEFRGHAISQPLAVDGEQ